MGYGEERRDFPEAVCHPSPPFRRNWAWSPLYSGTTSSSCARGGGTDGRGYRAGVLPGFLSYTVGRQTRHGRLGSLSRVTASWGSKKKETLILTLNNLIFPIFLSPGRCLTSEILGSMFRPVAGLFCVTIVSLSLFPLSNHFSQCLSGSECHTVGKGWGPPCHRIRRNWRNTEI